MIVKEFEFKMKDGRTAVIRSPREEDIQGLLDYLIITAGETEFLLRYPEECSKYTYEGEKAYIERTNASEYEASMVCIVDGRLVGNCQIMFNSGIKTRHRASVAIALIKEYWGQGIGSRLFEEMIRIAEESPYVTQLELDFIEGNNRGRALYEKMGFRIVAVHPNGIRLKDGTLLNDYSMIRPIEKA